MPAESAPARRRATDAATYAPVYFLIVAAVTQVAIRMTRSLAPWRGGGFGMFSTTDTTGERSLVIRHDRPGLTGPLAARPVRDGRFDLARVDPTPARVARLFRDPEFWIQLQREATGDPDATLGSAKFAVGVVAGRVTPDAAAFEERVVAWFRCEVGPETRCEEGR